MEIKYEKENKMNKNNTNKIDEQLSKYIRYRLGEPVLSVELKDEQIQCAYDEANELVNSSSRVLGNKEQWIRDYAFALSMETLGYIRSKFSSVALSSEEEASTIEGAKFLLDRSYKLQEGLKSRLIN